MPVSNRTWRPSERARDAAEAALEAELASLSHTSTLIIQHDESTATVDATRDHEVQLHTIEAHREGFSLVADSNSDRAPADARARGSPTLHLNLSITNPALGCHQPGGGGTEDAAPDASVTILDALGFKSDTEAAAASWTTDSWFSASGAVPPPK